MARSVLFVAVAGLTLTSCAAKPEAGTVSMQPSPDLVAKATMDAAAQVQRCYRTPKVFGAGRRITTRLAVRYAPDGSVIGVPMLLSQSGVTPDNAMFANAMATAAIESVVRCSPLHLPPELYAFGWSSFELTFSPALRG